MSGAPQPDRVEAAPDHFVYVFDVATELDQPTAITFNLQPDETFGRLEGQVGLDGGTFLTFDQFVYP